MQCRVRHQIRVSRTERGLLVMRRSTGQKAAAEESDGYSQQASTWASTVLKGTVAQRPKPRRLVNFARVVAGLVRPQR